MSKINPLSYCLFLLKSRPRSRFELDQAMIRKGIEEEDREVALRDLLEHGLIDDVAFAQAWGRNRDLLAPRGKILLRQELMKKGIAKDTIEQVLGERREMMEQGEQVDEVDMAKRLIAGKERQYAHLPQEVRKRRLMGLLGRRGFSYDIIKKALE